MHKKIKKIIGLFFFIYVITLTTLTTFAHSGDTDEYGGHNDYNNVSGLGAYHYHHGFSAHLHYEDGGCPFTSSNNSIIQNEPQSYQDILDSQSYQDTLDSMKLEEVKARRQGFSAGYSDGYAEKDRKNHDSFDDYDFANGYIEGYEKGHSAINKKNLIAYQDGYEDGLNNKENDNIYSADGLKSKYAEGFDEGLKIYNTKLAAEEKIKKQEMFNPFSILYMIIFISYIIYLIYNIIYK